MKRLLEERGRIASSPKEVFRMSALEGFINDPELWFEFLKKRNLTVHTYQETEALSVIGVCQAFSVSMRQFLQNIGASSD